MYVKFKIFSSLNPTTLFGFFFFKICQCFLRCSECSFVREGTEFSLSSIKKRLFSAFFPFRARLSKGRNHIGVNVAVDQWLHCRQADHARSRSYCRQVLQHALNTWYVSA